MKDIWIDWIMIIISLILLFWLVGVLNTCLDTFHAKKKELARTAVFQQPSEAEKKEINRLFRKHGIQSAVEGKDGRYYFWRDGQWCQLK